jgi:hypothetical protein
MGGTEGKLFSFSQKPLEAVVPFVKQPEPEKVMTKIARWSEGHGFCFLIDLILERMS